MARISACSATIQAGSVSLALIGPPILTKPAIRSAVGSRSPAYNCTGVQSNPNAPNSSAMRAGPSNDTCPTMATGCAHFMAASIRRRAQSVKVSHYM